MADDDPEDERDVAKGHNATLWHKQSDRKFIRRAGEVYGNEEFLAAHNVKFKEG